MLWSERYAVCDEPDRMEQLPLCRLEVIGTKSEVRRIAWRLKIALLSKGAASPRSVPFLFVYNQSVWGLMRSSSQHMSMSRKGSEKRWPHSGAGVKAVQESICLSWEVSLQGSGPYLHSL